MSALLIAEYRISQMKEKGILPKDGMIITTIVSSNLTRSNSKRIWFRVYRSSNRI